MKLLLLISSLLLLAGCAPVMAGNTITTVAMTIYGEAADQDYASKYAVASTIWNRANGKPSRLSVVCLSRKQYSCWRNRVFTQKLPDLRKPLDRLAWRDCVTLASIMCDGSFLPSLNSRHYHEASITPRWSINMPMVASVGDHVFYK